MLFRSFLPSTESDSNSIYEVLLILLKKQKKNLSDFLSKYDHGKPPKQSHEHHYDWVVILCFLTNHLTTKYVVLYKTLLKIYFFCFLNNWLKNIDHLTSYLR